MQPLGIFDMFDQIIADELGVDVPTYIDVIDKFNDEDMEYIINTTMDTNATQDDKLKAKQLFQTNLS